MVYSTCSRYYWSNRYPTQWRRSCEYDMEEYSLHYILSLWIPVHASYGCYLTPISNPLTSWERGYVGVPGISLSLYLCSLLLIRMHTMYDVYNATPACIIYSYYCPYSVCTYVHPCLAPAPLLLCVCYHIPIHIPMYVHLCTIQYTLRTTIYGTLPPLTHLHVRS